MKDKKRCRWCGEMIRIDKLKEHEENCNLNDGGRSDMNYEEVANKYF